MPRGFEKKMNFASYSIICLFYFPPPPLILSWLALDYQILGICGNTILLQKCNPNTYPCSTSSIRSRRVPMVYRYSIAQSSSQSRPRRRYCPSINSKYSGCSGCSVALGHWRNGRHGVRFQWQALVSATTFC